MWARTSMYTLDRPPPHGCWWLRSKVGYPNTGRLVSCCSAWGPSVGLWVFPWAPLKLTLKKDRQQETPHSLSPPNPYMWEHRSAHSFRDNKNWRKPTRFSSAWKERLKVSLLRKSKQLGTLQASALEKRENIWRNKSTKLIYLVKLADI